MSDKEKTSGSTSVDVEDQKIGNVGSVLDVDLMNVTSILSNRGLNPVIDHEMSEDEARITALGYKQEFNRELTLLSTFNISFSLLGLLPSTASCLWYSLYAGTVSMSWGWFVAWLSIQCVALSMAEIASSMPLSSGLYYASNALLSTVSPRWGPFASWCTGWSNFLVQVTSGPSIAYALTCMILALKSYHDDSFTYGNGTIFGVTTLFMFVQSAISSMPTKYIAWFNNMGGSLNMCFLVIAIIVILAADNREQQGLSRFNSNSFVWSTVTNQTEWSDGVAVLMSFLSIIWTMSGYDSAFHLAEESSNAAISVPRAISLTSLIGGIFGWFIQLTLAYTIVDLYEVNNDPLGQPFVTYCAQILESKYVDLVICMTIISSFFMGQAGMIAASRVTFAYSRDGCFPLSRIWRQVNSHTKTPVNAVWFNCFIGELLLLLIFAGETAIGAIFSVGALAAFIAFTIPVFIKLIIPKENFKPGPWNLGAFSKPIGALGCIFVIIMTPFLCWPYLKGKNNTPEEMNWTCVVYFGPMLLSIVWYIVDAHKWFKGPKLNVEHLVPAEKAE
ncbi:putative GABA/polyamine transporter [Ascoidea rubescens DSM 1968]|uniref:Putative GABA/polyamine transporter n=1 Tax=Ascoidea rubescens DSM 1968 TaxID=1344418 RepID=A0A1D2VJ73_9ASCO|nr:putative GABA/polyamine transporter [Ascoidea rubescens DSM 1968]ODV61678.1 putative GABA/polyamine transporter [Ascoidea rubescens DSM 1968]